MTYCAPLGYLRQQLLTRLFQCPLVFRPFVRRVERQLDKLLPRLEDRQLGGGQRGIETRLRIAFREVILCRGFVVRLGDHRLAKQQRIAFQRAASVVQIGGKQRTLRQQPVVVLLIFGNLCLEQSALMSQIVDIEIVAVVAALPQKVGPRGLELSQHIAPVEPRRAYQKRIRQGVGPAERTLQGGDIAVAGCRREEGDYFAHMHRIAVRYADHIEQPVVAGRKVRGRIDRRDRNRGRDRLRVFDEITAQYDPCKNAENNRHPPPHNPRRGPTQNRLGLLAVKIRS